MKKDTQRVEAIIEALRSVRKLVRDERIDGGNWEHIEHDLEKHEIAFTARLVDLREHNARIETQAKTNPAAPAASDSQ
jgi:hypothetical protein